MLFERIESTGLAHYSYLVGDRGEAVVIDPRRDVGLYVTKAVRRGYRITHILETHRNEDYLVGSPELALRTGAEIWHADSQLDYQYGQPVKGGQAWKVGRLKIEAILAPGHTLGMMNYLLCEPRGNPWIIFTGDALLAGDVGRVDLRGEEHLEEMAGLLYDTIFHKLLSLGNHVSICPAHGAGSVCGGSMIADRVWTTIGMERLYNPRLQYTERGSFIEQVAHMRERPPYFREMEERNLNRSELLSAVPLPTPLSVEQFASQARDGLILDTREVVAFNGAHIPGALSIWANELSSFAGWFLPYDRPLYLVLEKDDPDDVTRQLIRMGYDKLGGYLSGGMLAWHMAGQPSTSIQMATVQSLCQSLAEGERPWILDLRTNREQQQEGEIAGARHIPITQFPEHLSEVPRDRPVRIFCGSGVRSTIAASLLERAGWSSLVVTLGGIAAWSSVNCPIELVKN